MNFQLTKLIENRPGPVRKASCTSWNIDRFERLPIYRKASRTISLEYLQVMSNNMYLFNKWYDRKKYHPSLYFRCFALCKALHAWMPPPKGYVGGDFFSLTGLMKASLILVENKSVLRHLVWNTEQKQHGWRQNQFSHTNLLNWPSAFKIRPFCNAFPCPIIDFLSNRRRD